METKGRGLKGKANLVRLFYNAHVRSICKRKFLSGILHSEAACSPLLAIRLLQCHRFHNVKNIVADV
ncbi:unnamed protein product [Peronospora belbahrii]|uniref:Uncharacterized protein n=1 Tax=Peronospora belbahrii TaxID=622444 RepID=A0ABN8DFR6_9STRA|nr:unnamed protein product [Peronospora belbahrii]